MNDKDTTLTLMSMGYRSLAEDIWAKPVGYNVFIFDTKKMRWCSYFSACDDGKMYPNTIQDYQSDNFESFLQFIKEQEHDNTLRNGDYTGFEFLTNKDQFEVFAGEL